MTSRTRFVSAAAVIAGGVLSGLLFTTRAGGEVRRSLGHQVRGQRDRLAVPLHVIEARLGAIEQQIAAAGDQLGTRLRALTSQAAACCIPIPEEMPLGLHLTRQDIAHDLPGLPQA